MLKHPNTHVCLSRYSCKIPRTARDTKAREDYLKLLDLSARDKDSIYILDILRQEWKNDDERLR